MFNDVAGKALESDMRHSREHSVSGSAAGGAPHRVTRWCCGGAKLGWTWMALRTNASRDRERRSFASQLKW